MSLDEILSNTSMRLIRSHALLNKEVTKPEKIRKIDVSRIEQNAESLFQQNKYLDFLKAAFYYAENGDLQAYGSYLATTTMTVQQYISANKGQVKKEEKDMLTAIPELMLNMGLSFQYIQILNSTTNEIETKNYLNKILNETKKGIENSFGLLEKELLYSNNNPTLDLPKSKEEFESLVNNGDYKHFIRMAGQSAAKGNLEEYNTSLGLAYQIFGNTVKNKKELSEKEMLTLNAIQELMINVGISYQYIKEKNTSINNSQYNKAA